MRIFAIGDLHLSFSNPKPMDIFGEHWHNHDVQLARNWDETVCPEDMVLIAGDISWAMRPDEAAPDIEWIAQRPGSKVLIRGNHDFWWKRDATNRLQKSMPEGITLLQGDTLQIGSIWAAGTRGWRSEEDGGHSEKIARRELLYLERALQKIPKGSYSIALLHYPPFDSNLSFNAFDKLLREYRVKLVLYGHIHGSELIEGEVGGISYKCVAADRINFSPALIF